MIISLKDKEKFNDNCKVSLDYDGIDIGTGSVSRIVPRAQIKLMYIDRERNVGVVFNTVDLNVYLYHMTAEKTSSRISGLGYVQEESLNWMKSSEDMRDALMNNDLEKVFEKLEALSR